MVKRDLVARCALLFTLFLGSCLDGSSDFVCEGNRAARAGRLSEARSAYAKALEAQPRDIRARVLLAHTLVALHDAPGARSEYAAAMAQDTKNTGARVGLARLALTQHDASAALELLAPLAATTEISLLKARALLARGEPGDGARVQAELKDEGSMEAVYLKGSALLLDRRFAEAQATLEALEPISAPLARYGMARVAAAQGRVSDLVLHLQAAKAALGAAWDTRAVAADPAFSLAHDTPGFLPLLAK
jgi:hypothetical protein